MESSLDEIEQNAIRVLEYFQERYKDFDNGIVALNLVEKWRNAFRNGSVDLNETMNFCRDAEKVKYEYGLTFGAFYNTNTEINYKLWEEFLTDSLNNK